MIHLTRKGFVNIMNLLAVLVLVSCSSQPENATWFDSSLNVATQQYQILSSKAMEEGKQPRTLTAEGEISWVDPNDWTSGFFPGSLLYLYELTSDKAFLESGLKLTETLEGIQYNTSTHDLGFMIYCSYGNAYRISGEQAYAELMTVGAKSLASRYDSTTECIKSWDFGRWQYPVIIDNMMNLEYLLWASNYTTDDLYKSVAISHADKTMANHFREDYSSFHIVSYDTLTGEAEVKQTFQGYSDESSWSRGQGWALYGYTVMYRFTEDLKYLDHALGIANFILNHPNMPEDMIPYWDFDAPDIPNAVRDASAGALIASALLELSTFTDSGKQFADAAEKMLKSLSSPVYLAEPGTNQGFILKHCTGFQPEDKEVDVPLNYGDYYFLEALKRYRSTKKL